MTDDRGVDSTILTDAEGLEAEPLLVPTTASYAAERGLGGTVLVVIEKRENLGTPSSVGENLAQDLHVSLNSAMALPDFGR